MLIQNNHDINFSVINRDKYDALVLLLTITNE